jgi:NAD(P)-dependent dehydrogenase (short-subunit alcohol dehydrogenase family)
MTGSRPRVVWITGAGKGIGRALALKCAEEGFTVVVSARTASDLAALETQARNMRGTIHAFPLDITDAHLVAAVVVDVERTLGPIDLAVLNAGTHLPTPIVDFTPETVRALFEVNVMGTVNCLSALFVKREARRGCRIAVVASLAGYRGLPGASAYGGTKAALINMCEALKPECEIFGISLNVINPGFVKTPLTEKNDFPMPFLISAEAAAERIFSSLEVTRFETTFPTRFALIIKMLRLLPDRLYFPITRRILR